MAEYVTLIEAAELEGVKYKTMAQRLSRNPDKFDTMTEKLENGGKDAVLVAVASLSKKARNASPRQLMYSTSGRHQTVRR